MSEEKKCLNREELPEGVTELSMEDLEQVTGGVKGLDVKGGIGSTVVADVTYGVVAQN